MDKITRNAIRRARKLGFHSITIEPRNSGHSILHMHKHGQAYKISLPSSPKNYDEAEKLAMRNIEKLQRREKA